MLYIVIAVFIFILLLIVRNIRIVPQSKAVIIERLGGYLTTWGVGLHIKMPLIDRVAKTVSLKETVLDFPPQPVITRDNAKIYLDAVYLMRNILFSRCCSTESPIRR